MLSKSTSFSCGVCHIDFESNISQRAHMKTDWHVYNLKRRMASLPSLTLEFYTEHVVNAKDESISAGRAEFSEFSAEAIENHLRSEGHDHASENLGSDGRLADSIESITFLSNEAQSVPQFVPSRCLFCTITSPKMELNIQHMQKEHGLFIPDQEYLIDLETFLKYLFTIITEFNECLYCAKIKDSAVAIRQHMISKGHCNLRPDAGSEYEEFYDVASDEDAASGAEIEGREKSPEVLVPIDNELHLPSGRTLGHRSQARYYKQNKTTTDKSAERKAIKDTPESSRAVGINKQLATRNANMGMIGVPESKRRALRVFEKKMLKRQTRAQNQYRAAVEKGANKQKFFKPDVPGPTNG
ncbi:hypothetical protein L207DRAFT_575970 [Hyaloscypha variabilis F]|uniref:C2H2-type domain-containing protein n=1 Tax=Hyaloscypha variabilis (strain UAMH 11265 / GT02V1 / F) TaxID=1149755 RepID=A0A2J6S8T1_HYAVF|nr:hypothetical protein L207DRAFT_575970 [Hyaloscypha variabilis F]